MYGKIRFLGKYYNFGDAVKVYDNKYAILEIEESEFLGMARIYPKSKEIFNQLLELLDKEGVEIAYENHSESNLEIDYDNFNSPNDFEDNIENIKIILEEMVGE